MDKSLARGYASQTIASFPDVGKVLDYEASAVAQKARLRFAEASLAKKPTLVKSKMARFAPNFLPQRAVTEWDRSRRFYSMKGVFSCSQARLFGEEQDDAFFERTIVVGEIVMGRVDDKPYKGLIFGGAISHHAIQRMMMRELADPSCVRSMVKEIADLSQNVLLTMAQSERLYDATLNLLLPFRGGALVARSVNLEVAPGSHRPSSRTVSVRTWLGPEMITDEMRARMEVLGDIGQHGDFASYTRQAIRSNARPVHRVLSEAA